MTHEEHLENTVPVTGDGGEPFDIYLPVTSKMDGDGATHVAHMHGNRTEFAEVVAGFVATGSDLSAPLRGPIDDTDLDAVRFALQGLGPARVDSIDRL
jgi:hypothetical protein